MTNSVDSPSSSGSVSAQTLNPICVQAPLSERQRWFLSQQNPNPELFNQAVHLHLHTEVDARKLSRAIQSTLNRHGAFKAFFTAHSDGWEQRLVQSTVISPLEVLDLSASLLSKQFIRDQLQRMAGRLSLKEPPLIRFCLLRETDSGKSHLLIVAHHLIFDTHSWRILLRDLEASYTHLAEGRPLSLPKKTSSWMDYCLAQQDKKSEFANQKISVPNASEQDCLSLRTALPSDMSQKLLALTQHVSKLEMSHLLLAALCYTNFICRHEDVLHINVETSERSMLDQENTKNTIGWVTHANDFTFNVPNDCREEFVWTDLVFNVRQRLQHPGSPKHENSPSPRFAFKYLHAFETSWANTGEESIYFLRGVRNAVAYPVEITAWMQHGCLHLEWHYNINLVSKDEIERLANRVVLTLEKIISSFPVESHSAKHEGATPACFQEA